MSPSKNCKNILVVAAHADDEVLGCGGAICRHSKMGDRVHVVILTDGVGSRDHEQEKKEIQNRKKAAERASELLGVRSLSFLNFPDNKMDAVPLLDVIKGIDAAIEDFSPSIVYTHNFKDLNIDHQLAHRAVMTLFRPMPQSSVEKILCFEVLSSTEWISSSMGDAFQPNYYINITDAMDKKLEALTLYDNEMRDFPHSRSIEAVKALNMFRGASAGVHFAEAFISERIIEI